MFHRHSWVTISERFNAPKGGKISGADPDMVIVFTYGLTTIRQLCEECGRVRVETTPGDATR